MCAVRNGGEIQKVRQDRPARILGIEQIFHRHTRRAKNHLALATGLVHGWQKSCRHTLSARGHQNQTNAVSQFGPLLAHSDYEEIGYTSVGNIGFGPVENQFFPLAARRERNPLGIIATGSLGQGQSRDRLATGERRQPASLLRFVPGQLNRLSGENNAGET